MFELFEFIDFHLIENKKILELASGILGKSTESVKLFLSDILKKKEKGELTCFKRRNFKNILSVKEENFLSGLGGNWNLCFKATIHGFGSGSFREICSNKGETITIFQTTNGYISGGYTPIPWENGYGGEKRDSKSFLFNLRNPKGDPPQIFGRCELDRDSEFSTSQTPYNGFFYFLLIFSPHFGSHDLILFEGYHNKCRSYLGKSYGKEYMDHYKLSGATNEYFSVTEVEVYFRLKRI
jgi:hypothetical protein